MKKIKWRKWNRVIHRDLGYFFFGMTIIYCLSGIAINHLDDWNPNFIITTKQVKLEHSISPSINKEQILEILDEFNEKRNYKNHYFPNPSTLKIFLVGGSVIIDTEKGTGEIELIRRRPIFHEVNYLHYNPVIWWAFFSDLFAGALILVAVTGLFIIRGKNGITKRGAWLTISGIIIPVIFLLIYH